MVLPDHPLAEVSYQFCFFMQILRQAFRTLEKAEWSLKNLKRAVGACRVEGVGAVTKI
jgi:hypothetical protein